MNLPNKTTSFRATYSGHPVFVELTTAQLYDDDALVDLVIDSETTGVRIIPAVRVGELLDLFPE